MADFDRLSQQIEAVLEAVSDKYTEILKDDSIIDGDYRGSEGILINERYLDNVGQNVNAYIEETELLSEPVTSIQESTIKNRLIETRVRLCKEPSETITSICLLALKYLVIGYSNGMLKVTIE